MPRRLVIVVMTLALGAGLSSCAHPPIDSGGGDHDLPPPPPPAAPGSGTVVAITDGDTLRLEVDGVELRVRLIGIDTPEVRDPLECFGPEATAALEALAPVGDELAFSYDRDPRDPYDRELLYLYAADGTLINLELVANGYARAVLFEPNDAHWDELRAAESAARVAGLGLWGACPAT